MGIVSIGCGAEAVILLADDISLRVILYSVLHPMPGTGLTIDLDGTEVTIPIVGGEIK